MAAYSMAKDLYPVDAGLDPYQGATFGVPATMGLGDHRAITLKLVHQTVLAQAGENTLWSLNRVNLPGIRSLPTHTP